MRKLPGFTMLETLIAGVIGIMVLGAATIAVLAITNTLNLQKARAGLDEESKLLADFLMARIQSAGNEYIRPWAVVYAHDEGGIKISHQIDEDNRSDALTIGQAMGQKMTVITWQWTLGNKSIDLSVSGTETCGQCPALENKHVVLYNSSQTAYYPAFITSQEPSVVTMGECTGDTVNDANVSVRCRYDLEESKSGVKPINSHLIFGVNSNLISMQEVTFETYYLVINETFKIHQLWGYQDRNNNGRPDAANNERYTLANDVYDLQISFGYDYSPQDRHLQDYESDDDEWFNNAVNECTPIVEPFVDYNSDGYLVPQGAQPSQLRMVAVGLTVGKRIRGIGRDQKFSFVQHFNGDCLNPYGYHLRGTKSRAMLRSLNLYEP